MESIPISRKRIRTLLRDHAQRAREELKSILSSVDSKISLALDCWSSRNGHAFLGITHNVQINSVFLGNVDLHVTS